MQLYTYDILVLNMQIAEDHTIFNIPIYTILLNIHIKHQSLPGGIGVMALGAAAARTPSSRKNAGTRAAHNAVALQASKVDSVCIVGCSGAVGKDWRMGYRLGMAVMAMEESEKF